jgi:predicted HTH domain antitoxin
VSVAAYQQRRNNRNLNPELGKRTVMKMRSAHAKEEPGTVAVTVEIPSDIARQYGPAPDQIARRLLEQAAVEGYRTRQISRGQVAQMLRMDWAETEEFLAQHHCDRHYDLDDLEADRHNLDKIFGPV